MRADQDDGDRYDQLLGGDGNLISELNDLSLDFFSARFEKLGGGLFDHASLTYSLNSQREERVNQGGNGNPTATIGHEPERTTVHGIQGWLTKQFSTAHDAVGRRRRLLRGADVGLLQRESGDRRRHAAASARSRRRDLHSGRRVRAAAFDAVPDRVRLVGALRFGGAHYEAQASDSPIVNGQPLWPDDSLTASARHVPCGRRRRRPRIVDRAGSISRGFRAPHMTDLGTLGLTGSGYEVAAPDVAGLDGCVGTTADATAVSHRRSRSSSSVRDAACSTKAACGYRREGVADGPHVLRQQHPRQHPEAGARSCRRARWARCSAASRSRRRTPTASCSFQCPRCRCWSVRTSTTRASGASSTARRRCSARA